MNLLAEREYLRANLLQNLTPLKIAARKNLQTFFVVRALASLRFASSREHTSTRAMILGSPT
jgi:hypothetical protein